MSHSLCTLNVNLNENVNVKDIGFEIGKFTIIIITIIIIIIITIIIITMDVSYHRHFFLVLLLNQQ